MSLEALIANLNHVDETERVYAAQDLGDTGDPLVIAPLCNRLKTEQSRAVKEALVTALGRIQHDEVLAALTELLQTDDTFVCNEAVRLLAERGAPALRHVEKVLRSGDEHLRKLALDAVGRIHSPDAERLYRVALQDENPNLVITAVEYIGVNAVNNLKPEMEEIFQTAHEPMLLTAVLETLSIIGDSNTLRLVLNRFQDLSAISEMLQYPVLKVLGSLGNPGHAMRIVRLLQQNPERLIQPAVDALISIQTRMPSKCLPADAMIALRELLEGDISDLMRYQIVVLLWRGQPGGEIQNLIQAQTRRLQTPDLVRALQEQMFRPLAV